MVIMDSESQLSEFREKISGMSREESTALLTLMQRGKLGTERERLIVQDQVRQNFTKGRRNHPADGRECGISRHRESDSTL
jgi:hypothetical protein